MKVELGNGTELQYFSLYVSDWKITTLERQLKSKEFPIQLHGKSQSYILILQSAVIPQLSIDGDGIHQGGPRSSFLPV